MFISPSRASVPGVSIRTLLIALAAFVGGGAGVLAVSRVFGSPPPPHVAPIEVTPRPAQPRESASGARGDVRWTR